MMTEFQLRSLLIRRIQKIPSNKLIELYKLVSKLEQTPSNKGKIVSFAETWDNMDSETLNNLTDHPDRKSQSLEQESPGEKI